MKTKRAKLLEKAIRQVWSSMESHLPFAYHGKPHERDFDIKCVQEYAKLLVTLSDLY